MDEDNDGRFPDDSAVEVRYPRDKRKSTVTGRHGRGSWIDPRASAGRMSGTYASRSASWPRWTTAPAPPGTATRTCLPCCFRDASETGVPPAGRNGDPRDGGGQLAFLAGDH